MTYTLWKKRFIIAIVFLVLGAQQCWAQEVAPPALSALPTIANLLQENAPLPALPELPPPPTVAEPLQFDYEGKAEPSLPNEDKNGDGSVTKTEMLSYWNYLYDRAIWQRNPEKYFGMLSLFELDNNGIVTRKEILTYYNKMFDGQDTNHNGTLSSQEKQAYEERLFRSMECGMPLMALEAQTPK